MSLSKPEYGFVVDEDVMAPMRDGVRLATDIYRPANDGKAVPGPLPTILGRTSYDKRWRELWIEPVARYFAPRGYVVVLQDLRGRRRSEGVGQYFHTANEREGEDGYDTVEWIAAQPWSNGRVGMTGSSHGALVQTVASLTRPPHLTCIWADVTPTNIFAHEAREGGAMSLWMFSALFLHAHDAPEIADDPGARETVLDGWRRMRELVQSMPFRPGETPLRAVPNLEKTLFDYYYRGEYDEFWAMEACNQEPHFHKAADIPGVYSGGWYDAFAVAATGQYAAMAANNSTPQRLDMGPWNHRGRRNGHTWAGDVDFGPEAAYGIEGYGAQRLRWFDRWLKDVPQRRGGRAPSPDIRHGRRQRGSECGRAARPRRPLAGRARVASCPNAVHQALPARRRRPLDRSAGSGRPAGHVHPRPEPSRANDLGHRRRDGAVAVPGGLRPGDRRPQGLHADHIPGRRLPPDGVARPRGRSSPLPASGGST